MGIDYICTGSPDMKHKYWTGHIEIQRTEGICEMEVSARDSYFHIICGRHKYGLYLCVPNWGIGTEVASLGDRFWNLERLLQTYPEISSVDNISIVDALGAVGKYITL